MRKKSTFSKMIFVLMALTLVFSQLAFMPTEAQEPANLITAEGATQGIQPSNSVIYQNCSYILCRSLGPTPHYYCNICKLYHCRVCTPNHY